MLLDRVTEEHGNGARPLGYETTLQYIYDTTNGYLQYNYDKIPHYGSKAFHDATKMLQYYDNTTANWKKRTSLDCHLHLLTIPSCHADLGNPRLWTLDPNENLMGG
jgi:hypothetical protein